MAYFQSTPEFQNQVRFRQRLIDLLSHAKCYEDRRKQVAALAVVPSEDLIQISRAKDKYESSFSINFVGGRVGEKSEDVIRDILLLELLDWFKNNFFKWMNQPVCPRCNGVTELIGQGAPTVEEMQNSATRVEIYTCSQCFPNEKSREVARFPRYNDPVVLLKTRVGRCGEWANCFALICRAMGFEVRHVTDWLDHVWVEIYSETKGKYIHCDPCENKWDSPLLYEEGWGKQLTYVVAVSHEDIQDVTWRYSHSDNHKSVLLRRTLVDENWLVKTIVQLRNQQQSFLPEGRKNILKERVVKELVEFLSPTNNGIKDSEKCGRESGSLAWRIARGEIGSSSCRDEKMEGYEWEITEESLRLFGSKLKLYYDCALDSYFIGNSTNEVKRGWKSGLYEAENLFRKEEKDWSMVYLARQESNASRTGKLSWKFKIDDSIQNLAIESIHLFMKSATFHHSAKVLVEVSSDKERFQVPPSGYTSDGVWIWKSTFGKTRFAKITCTLDGGDGNLAWQHAQLFRQSTEAESQCREPTIRPFRIVVNVRRLNASEKL